MVSEMRASTNGSREIREVWASNLEDEFHMISQLAEHYCYVGLDTEFPGFLSMPSFQMADEQRYYTQSLNVNLLSIIQIGITLGDESQKLCTPCCTWQFNFRFSQTEDLWVPDAIKLLEKANIDFSKFERDGIEARDFAHLLLASGLVMNDGVVWISYHGSYDFAYLIKMLTASPLPAAEDQYSRLLRSLFPHHYDVKQIAFVLEQRIGGLQDVVTNLGIQRIGTEHQAGSDSYVTLLAFYRLMRTHYDGVLKQERFKNVFYGLAG
jgi:CCR4-NOT transcription complex subunit 7/8